MKPKKRKSPKRRPVRRERLASGISASLQAWATALGMERRTLESRLTRAEYQAPKQGGKIPARVIYVALVGDKEAEQVRALKLDNEERERNAKRETGELFPLADLEAWLSQHYLVPMSNVFAGMAAAIDTRCNSQDPAQARRAIEDYVEGTVKPALRAALEKPKTKGQK